MIYKDPDNKEAVVLILERMLSLAGPDRRALIERELRAMRAGMRNERQAACLLDAHLKDATRTAVVHDLRLDLGGGQVAQIDHLLIHRTRRFYILDSKCFAGGLKVTEDGQFLRWDDTCKTFDLLPSPLPNGACNVAVLRAALARLGVEETPVEAVVLVAPSARLERPRRFDTTQVVRADRFIERLATLSENRPPLSPLGGLLRSGLYDSIGDIARKLVELHRPSAADYRARFGLGLGLGLGHDAASAGMPASLEAARELSCGADKSAS